MQQSEKTTAPVHALEAELDVFIVKEGDAYVAYCPALQLTTYGDSQHDAENAFKEAMQIFIEETREYGTLERELIDMGWTLSKGRYVPPRYPSDAFTMFLPREFVVAELEQLTIPA